MSFKDLALVGGKGSGSGSFKSTPDTLRSTDSFEALIGITSSRATLAPGGLQNLFVNDIAIEDENGHTNLTDFTAILFDGDPTILNPIKLNLGSSAGPSNINLTLTNPPQNQGMPGPWVNGTVLQQNVDFIDLRFVVNQLLRQDKNGIYETDANIEVQLRPSGDIGAGGSSPNGATGTQTEAYTWTNPLENVPAPNYNRDGIDFGDALTVFAERGIWDTSGTGWANNSTTLQISGKTTSPYVKEMRIAVPNTGAYANKTWEVRCRLMERDSYTGGEDNLTEEHRDISWESVAGVSSAPIGGTEGWRGLSYLQVVGKASDQLNGIPTINGIYDFGRYAVPPMSVFNPADQSYTGAAWDGVTNQIAWTQCPAWQIKGLIEDGLSGVSALVPGSTLNKWDALEASKWFATRVPDGRGGTQPRYTMNWIIEQPQNVNELMNYLAGAVGAFAWDEGDGNWRLKAEKPETPQMIFTKENIIGEFVYQHTDWDSRFNDITGVYRDRDNRYKETRVRTFDQVSIDQTGRRPTQLVLVGCDNRQEALRRIELRKITALNETRLVTFTTNRQGGLLEPFSVIGVADGDLNSSQTIRSTGRIINISADRKSITVRDSLRLEVGVGYTAQFTVPNPAYAPNVLADPTGTDWMKPTIAITRTITNTALQRGDVYTLNLDQALPANLPDFAPVALSAVGLPALPKQYRVLAVVPDDSGENVAITASEIYTAKWLESDNVVEDEILAQTASKTVPSPIAPTGGMFVQKSFVADYAQHRVLSVNWQRPLFSLMEGYRIEMRFNGGAWQDLGITKDTMYELSDPVHGAYEFQIYVRDRKGRESAPLAGNYTVTEVQLVTWGGIADDGNKPEDNATNGATSGVNLTNNVGAVVGDSDILNNKISIGANGALVGANGGQVTFSGIGGKALGLLDAVDLSTTYTTGLLPVAKAVSGLVNSNVSIANNGALTGGGGGQVTFSGIGGKALGLLDAVDLTSGYATGLLPATKAASGLVNSNVSIANNGALTGGGGGQVTIGGLGFTGALDATKGATWGVDVGGANLPANNAGKILDTRSNDSPPSYYYAQRSASGVGEVQEFKDATFSTFGGYGHLLTVTQWSDSSGGPVKQTYTDANGAIFERISTSTTTWGAWGRNYNAVYKPRLGSDLLDSAGGSLTDNGVLNNKISIGANGALVGANGGQVTYSGIGGKAVGLLDAVDLSTTYTTGLLPVTKAVSGLVNSNVSIGNNGALTGGGGGQVTIGGLGFTGDTDAQRNSRITISGNLLSGIGVGDGTAVANAAISIGANGALVGANGGQVTYVGIGGKAVGLLDAVDLSTTYTTGLLPVAKAVSGLVNSNVSIGNNGALTGGGGGQVTISGLGFTGDLNATLGATWGTNLAGRPANVAALTGTEGINNAGITISANAIQGIGTGNGTAVGNAAISIGANGALVGANGGQVTFGGLGGKALGLLDTVDLSTTYATGLLPTTKAASGLINTSIGLSGVTITGIGTGNGTAVANSGISIGSNGALVGGNGGQVTIGGLGYKGNLKATDSDNQIADPWLDLGAFPAAWFVMDTGGVINPSVVACTTSTTPAGNGKINHAAKFPASNNYGYASPNADTYFPYDFVGGQKVWLGVWVYVVDTGVGATSGTVNIAVDWRYADTSVGDLPQSGFASPPTLSSFAGTGWHWIELETTVPIGSAGGAAGCSANWLITPHPRYDVYLSGWRFSSTQRGATFGATWSSNLLNRPANLAALTGSEAVNNAGISIAANGALSGGSGGQVTIGGLGFTGDTDAQRNSRITISSNAIQGIGTGSGTAVANAGISIGANGALIGANGGQVTIGGLGYTGTMNADNTAQSLPTVTRTVTTKTIAADYTGTISASLFPATVAAPLVSLGGTDKTTDAITTYAITNATGGCAGNVTVDNTSTGSGTTRGVQSISSGFNASGTYDLQVSVNGTLVATIHVTVTKTIGSAPTGGGSGGGSTSGTFSTSGWVSPSASTSYAEVGRVSSLTVASGKTIHGIGSDDYFLTIYSGTFNSKNMNGKWQYSVAGANSWSDFQPGPTPPNAVTGTAATYDTRNGNASDGSITVNQNVTPSAGTYDVRFVAASSTSFAGNLTFYGNNTFSVTVS